MSAADDCRAQVWAIARISNGDTRDWSSPQLREVVRRAKEVCEECPTCGCLHGGHERGCPDSAAAGDQVDAAIDRMKEQP